MAFTITALVLGVVLGFLAGGRPSNVARHPIRAVAALAAAVAFQVVPQHVSMNDTVGLVCVLSSYALLLVFAVANLRLMGMPVVLTGLLLNIAVITVNGGMPVRGEAILTADRYREPSELANLDFGAKRHLEDGSDKLTFLGDVLPLRGTGQVMSFGDLILAAGIGNVAFRLIKPRGSLSRRRHSPPLEVVAVRAPVSVTMPTARAS